MSRKRKIREISTAEKEIVHWTIGESLDAGNADGFKKGKNGFPISRRTQTQIMRRFAGRSSIDRILDRMDNERGDA